MPEKDDKGQIVITIQDIYEQQNDLSESVRELSHKFDKISHKIDKAYEVEELSREALQVANEADRKAEEALQNDKTMQEQKTDFRNMLTKALVASLLPWGMTILVGLIIILGKEGLI